MGRLLGYMAGRADNLQEVLKQERSLISPPAHTGQAGWGIGFYQGGEVLHKKCPLLEGKKIEWEEMADHVHTDCAILHVRQATVGGFHADNTHPFRMRSWLFAHSGTLDRFAAIRNRLTEPMPDFLRRNIRGETDSEHIFHTILSFLHDSGQLDNPDVDPTRVAHGIRSTVRLVDQLSAEVGAEPGNLNLILTNGRHMFALRRGAPFMFVERHPSTVERQESGARASASPLRYALLVSNPPVITSECKPLEDSTILVVDHRLNVSTIPLAADKP